MRPFRSKPSFLLLSFLSCFFAVAVKRRPVQTASNEGCTALIRELTPLDKSQARR